MKGLLAASFVAVAFVVGGCGSSKSSSPATNSLTGVSSSTTSSTTEAASSRCKPLPRAAANLLNSVLYTGRLGHPVDVRSKDFAHIYFVAAKVHGEPALWAMNRLDGSGHTLGFSENTHAFDVSGLGYGDKTDAHITASDDGASAALSCVKSA